MFFFKYFLPLFISLLIYGGYKLYNYGIFAPYELPIILNNQCWGVVCDFQDNSTLIRPFKVQFSNDTIIDLKYRLNHHRPFTPPLEGIAQEYGTNTILLKKIIDHWRTKYDFKERENYLNQLPQFITNIQGLDIHYIHVKPKMHKNKNLKVIPLLMLHGWPGSLREFYDIIPILTNWDKKNSFVFEVIAPHIPGFGFSSGAIKPGLGPPQISEVLKNLMERLGFHQFYVQGGDFGAIILQMMSFLYPDTVLGFHSNMCTVSDIKSFAKMFLGYYYPSWIVKEGHYNRIYPLHKEIGKLIRETGYLHLQATKPDTIGVALSDSPIGLASYIVEKFVTGTNFSSLSVVDGDLEKYFSYTEILDNIMIYWITNSATTSFRLYAETFNKVIRGLDAARPVIVPTACARFENDFYAPDGVLPDIYHNLLQLTDYHGGHFAALQLPEVLAKDIYDGVEKFQAFHTHHKQNI